MTLHVRIEQLRQRLVEPDMRLWEVFLTLFEFIEQTPGASLRWFGTDPDALERLPFNAALKTWSAPLREHALGNIAFANVLDIAGLGIALDQIYAAGEVSNETSLALITALLVIEHAYRGLHPAEISPDDSMHFVELRTRLRQLQSLFDHERFHVITRPRRTFARIGRGQANLNSFLRHLVVVEPPNDFELEYSCYFPMRGRARSGFRRIGIVPTIAHAGELTWACEGDNRYTVEVSAAARTAVGARVLAALEELGRRKTDLVVLPELVGADWLDQVIEEWMGSARPDDERPTLVVAGTRMTVDSAGQIRNKAHMLAGNGELIWTQDKLHAYTFTEIEQRSANCPLGHDDIRHRTEAIAVDPRKLTIVDLSSSQRVVVLICEDFAQEDPHAASIRALQATMLLVPVMAGGREREDQTWLHRRGMDYVQQPGAASVVANSGALVLTDRDVAASYSQVLADPRVRGAWVPIQVAGEPIPIAWFIDLDRPV